MDDIEDRFNQISHDLVITMLPKTSVPSLTSILATTRFAIIGALGRGNTDADIYPWDDEFRTIADALDRAERTNR